MTERNTIIVWILPLEITYHTLSDGLVTMLMITAVELNTKCLAIIHKEYIKGTLLSSTQNMISSYDLIFSYQTVLLSDSLAAHIRVAGCSATTVYSPKLPAERGGQRGADQVVRGLPRPSE